MWRVKTIIFSIMLLAATSCSKDIPYVPEDASRS